MVLMIKFGFSLALHSLTSSKIGGGTFHHNLLANCSGRNWSLTGGLDGKKRIVE